MDPLYDSAESFPQPKCHPETRKELLDKLYRWATDPHSTYSIHWLHGPAGAGKSAVMQTLCRQLQDAGRFGGSFFFKREHKTCGNAKVIFATLAYQLALNQHDLKTLISKRIEADPSVLARSMDVQLRTLIVEPCKLLQDAPPSILLIDGLDECDGHKIQQELLRLIGSIASDRCFRILVASRPEPHIREIFKSCFPFCLYYIDAGVPIAFLKGYNIMCLAYQGVADVWNNNVLSPRTSAIAVGNIFKCIYTQEFAFFFVLQITPTYPQLSFPSPKQRLIGSTILNTLSQKRQFLVSLSPLS